MPDARWDAQGLPPTRGRSSGKKLALGCALAFVVVVGGCVAAVGGAAWWGMKRGGELLDQAWGDLRDDLRKVQTDEGAADLYRDNPGLAERYPTQEDFLKASRGWRTRLAEVPEPSPDFKDALAQKGGLRFQSRIDHDVKRTLLRYPLPQGGVLFIETKNGRLADFGVE